jgi:hypothetical protein
MRLAFAGRLTADHAWTALSPCCSGGMLSLSGRTLAIDELRLALGEVLDSRWC